MTIKEKSKKIEEWCMKQTVCEGCRLEGHPTCYSYHSEVQEAVVAENYDLIFGRENSSVDEPVENSSVNHPSHYNKGKIEVIDFIADQKLNFARGNAVKYVCRAGSKDPEKEIQDLEKAIWYINHEIKMLKGETSDGTEEET